MYIRRFEGTGMSPLNPLSDSDLSAAAMASAPARPRPSNLCPERSSRVRALAEEAPLRSRVRASLWAIIECDMGSVDFLDGEPTYLSLG